MKDCPDKECQRHLDSKIDAKASWKPLGIFLGIVVVICFGLAAGNYISTVDDIKRIGEDQKENHKIVQTLRENQARTEQKIENIVKSLDSLTTELRRRNRLSEYDPIR